MNKECENVSLYFYGEMEPVRTADFEKHLHTCPHCQKDLAFLRQMQGALVPPAAPQAAVQSVLEHRKVGWWGRMWRPAAAAGLAAVLAVVFFASGPRMQDMNAQEADLLAYVSAELDEEYNNFALEFEAFEEAF